MDKEKVKDCIAELKGKLDYLEELVGGSDKPKSLEELKDMAYKNKDEEEESKDKSDAV